MQSLVKEHSPKRLNLKSRFNSYETVPFGKLLGRLATLSTIFQLYRDREKSQKYPHPHIILKHHTEYEL